MSLLKRTIPLCNLEQVDPKILLKEVKAGNKEAFDRMVLGHTGLAVSIVNSYIRRDRVIFLVDELDGAAFEGIVVAIDRIRKGHLSHDNYTGYIVYYIHEYIRKQLKKSRFFCQWESQHPEQKLFDETGLIDLWDQLSKIIETDFEKQIIELRSLGHTDKETAEKLNVPETTVLRTRHKLKKRLANERMA